MNKIDNLKLMSKTQKIWLWISVALFTIPEILWSPVVNFMYTIYRGGNVPSILRDNFLVHSDYRRLAIMIIFLQSMGALFTLFIVCRSSASIIARIFLSFFVFILFILSFFVFIFLSMTVNI